MRRTLIAANWKMHLDADSVEEYCRRLAGSALGADDPEAVLFPGFTLLHATRNGLAGTGIRFGGQDLHPEDQGAHTGDVSGPQLRDAGCTWVLCGHSERRHDHHEGADLVGRKVEAAQRNDLRPMLCIGETAEEREQGRTEEVLAAQLLAALPAGEDWVVAYEPVWAIGTGQVATPEMAQETHAMLRALLSDQRGAAAAGRRILYGGSVKPGNCADLIAQPDIDGFLIGGASLDPDSFLDIIRRCA